MKLNGVFIRESWLFMTVPPLLRIKCYSYTCLAKVDRSALIGSISTSGYVAQYSPLLDMNGQWLINLATDIADLTTENG